MATSDRDIVWRQRIVQDLADLVTTHSNSVQQAGARVMFRIGARSATELDQKRRQVVAQRQLIERARKHVLSGDLVIDDADLHPSDRAELGQLISLFSRYETPHTNREDVSAMDAYLAVYVAHYRAEEKRHGEPRTPARQVRARRVEALDPDQTSNAMHELAYQLAVETKRFMRQEADRVRTRDEWWEVVLLVLGVEHPDLTAEELGFSGELPWGAWEKAGVACGLYFALVP